MKWFNEPPSWRQDGDRLTMTCAHGGDFWRSTHYGFITDSGHFGYVERHGDFTAHATVRGRYQALYDQAGLMLRSDARTWIKTGIEMTDGLLHLSVVVTREYSDWSVIPMPAGIDVVGVRLSRHGTAIRVEYRIPDQDGWSGWRMARLAYFPESSGGAPLQIGVMACAPRRESGQGFEASFEGFQVGEAISPELHQQDS